MSEKTKPATPTVLSPRLAEIWGFVPVWYLILASEGYIVFLDETLDVEWKTTAEWDKSNVGDKPKLLEILNRVAEIETAEWNATDEGKTIKFKRQIGESLARAFDGDFASAHKMLDKAEAYRQDMVRRRKEAIVDQIEIRDSWRTFFSRWNATHYIVGIAALLLSSLVASKPLWLGLNENHISFCAWLVAALTGALTFLTPDKKADKYNRAWSILNSEITRYNANDAATVDDVLNACRQGESIIHDTSTYRKKRS